MCLQSNRSWTPTSVNLRAPLTEGTIARVLGQHSRARMRSICANSCGAQPICNGRATHGQNHLLGGVFKGCSGRVELSVADDLSTGARERHPLPALAHLTTYRPRCQDSPCAMHTYTHARTHTRKRARTIVRTHARMHACMRIRLPAHTSMKEASMPIHLLTHMTMCTSTHMSTHMHCRVGQIL